MDPILLRFIERLTAVLIGGLAIYLGYRLFQSVPEQRDSAGKLELPKLTIVFTRVGPGVFFALFGVVAVGLSLLQPLQLGLPEQPGSVRYAGTLSSNDANERADERALLRRDFALLNNLPRQLPMSERDAVKRGVVRIKLALMEPVWGTEKEGYGDFQVFNDWARYGDDSTPPADSRAAVELWRYGESSP